jgi:hypothetical protein
MALVFYNVTATAAEAEMCKDVKWFEALQTTVCSIANCSRNLEL